MSWVSAAYQITALLDLLINLEGRIFFNSKQRENLAKGYCWQTSVVVQKDNSEKSATNRTHAAQLPQRQRRHFSFAIEFIEDLVLFGWTWDMLMIFQTLSVFLMTATLSLNKSIIIPILTSQVLKTRWYQYHLFKLSFFINVWALFWLALCPFTKATLSETFNHSTSKDVPSICQKTTRHNSWSCQLVKNCSSVSHPNRNQPQCSLSTQLK